MIRTIEQLAYAGSYEQYKQAAKTLADAFSDITPSEATPHADRLEAALSTVNAAAAQFQQCHDALESPAVGLQRAMRGER